MSSIGTYICNNCKYSIAGYSEFKANYEGNKNNLVNEYYEGYSCPECKVGVLSENVKARIWIKERVAQNNTPREQNMKEARRMFPRFTKAMEEKRKAEIAKKLEESPNKNWQWIYSIFSQFIADSVNRFNILIQNSYNQINKRVRVMLFITIGILIVVSIILMKLTSLSKSELFTLQQKCSNQIVTYLKNSPYTEVKSLITNYNENDNSCYAYFYAYSSDTEGYTTFVINVLSGRIIGQRTMDNNQICSVDNKSCTSSTEFEKMVYRYFR